MPDNAASWLTFPNIFSALGVAGALFNFFYTRRIRAHERQIASRMADFSLFRSEVQVELKNLRSTARDLIATTRRVSLSLPDQQRDLLSGHEAVVSAYQLLSDALASMDIRFPNDNGVWRETSEEHWDLYLDSINAAINQSENIEILNSETSGACSNIANLDECIGRLLSDRARAFSGD